jgi:aminopeptidase N
MTNAAAPASKKNRLDYKEPDFFIRHVDLEFDIRDGETFVTAVMKVERNGTHTHPLVLDGNKLETLDVEVDGQSLAPLTGYQTTDETLAIPTADDVFELRTRVKIEPEKNTALEGLYKSDAMWCTQCEATGFRNITWFIDRPDNMASYKVKVIADQASPVLLSNGNMIDQGATADGRHYTVWNDPAPKPSYLFALVAADLDHLEDTFTTMSGRDVTLRIYAEAKDKDKLTFAMDSLKRSMRWDEVNYGREYELDLFNIVAVGNFNMGAMENRSLNIFNTAYVLAHPRTQSDAAFAGVEGVIAHEFFHHWTGNNVTLRDWPELTLKEGLTVFRDQSFSSDMGSAAINRIKNVQGLRAAQFKQDAGPLAHPIRADEYESINNFYTGTVYQKGSEVIRMVKTLIGDQDYRKATDLYFQRFTGKAVTCDDFVQCMQDASGYDMSQFKLWYSQAGTPRVEATWTHDAATQKLALTLTQKTPENRPDNLPVVIPVRFGIVGPQGGDMALDQQGHTETVLALTQEQQTFTFDNIPAGSVPSLLRGFSAPVVLKADYSDNDLLHLMVHDSDGFNQWEAGHQLVLKEMLAQVDNAKSGKPVVVEPTIIDALRGMINRPGMDKQLLALMLGIPGYSDLSQKSQPVNPDAIQVVEKAFTTAIRTELAAELQALYQANNVKTPWTYDVASVGRRALKNIALYYLTADETANNPTMTIAATAQYKTADNMTDKGAGLRALLRMDYSSPHARSALDDYYQSYKADDLVIDNWFGMSVGFAGQDAVTQALALTQHPDFHNPSPNRIRSVVGGVVGTAEAFHKLDGTGYAFIAEQIIGLDPKNPQTAARFVDSLADFAKYAEPWQSKMKAALQMVASQPKLSTDVDDKLKRILGADYPAKSQPGTAAPAPAGP